jgi:hypothetical protein
MARRAPVLCINRVALSLDIISRSVAGVTRAHLLRQYDTKFTRANNQVITNELHASKLGDNFGRIFCQE